MCKTHLQFFLSFVTVLIIVTSCIRKEKVDTPKDIFEVLAPGYDLMAFMAEIEKKDMAEVSDSLEVKFKRIGFEPVKSLPFIIGNDTVTKLEGLFMWVNPNNGVSVFMYEFNNNKDANSQWLELRQHIDRYTGIDMGGGGTYYLKLEPDIPSSLNATFLAGKKIFQFRKPLGFTSSDHVELNETQQQEVVSANENIIEALNLLVEVFVSEKNKIYKPLNGKFLTEDERLLGFINFWTEVKYNFAFFDQVPNLNWQQVLIDYLPKVRNASSNLEYFRILQEVCALLNDGHTNIFIPSELESEFGFPAVTISPIDDALFITNTDIQFERKIPLGSKLIKVDGLPVEKFIEKQIRPYISSSTEHIRRNIEAHEVLKGMRTDSVRIEILTPENQLRQLSLSRNPSDTEWIIKNEPWELSSFRKIGDIAYVSLNSFGNSQIVEEFEGYLDSIQSSRALIIDLRKNGGGSSWNGYNILKHLTDRPIITSKWKTREHKPAYKAWGAFVDGDSDNLGSWDREVLASYNDDYWFESGPDTIAPSNGQVIKLPTVVLVGNNTGSAAEDFLVAADPIDHFTTMGDFTYGSTGQPMILRLPGGGKARICTKRDTYPDGREFVGYGIQPDILVSRKLEDILTEEDSVLKRALNNLIENL
ncbi:S41 family peptidase [Flagellimonas marinaquae]